MRRPTLLWAATIVLVLVGLTASIGRALHPVDFTAVMEPLRRRVFDAFHATDPFAAERSDVVRRFDSRYAAHPGLILLHVIPGGLFLLFAPLQFIPAIRRRAVNVHRWSGRVLLVLASLAAVPALFFGLVAPFAGTPERLPIAVFATFWLVAMGQAWRAIRRGDVARHREWMIRGFAAALAIATDRVIMGLLDLPMSVAGFRPPSVFVISITTGWLLTLAGAELWIRATRPRPSRESAPAASPSVASVAV